MYKIYIHQNKKNLKIYVGFTFNHIKRWRDTKSNAFNHKSKTYNEPLYRAIRKYGWDEFWHQIIEEFDNKEDALESEKFWIEFFRSNCKIYGHDCGYNLHEGGNLPPICKVSPMKGKKHSEETKQKMSKSKIGNINCLGNKASIITKKKMSESSKNKPKSEKAKKNMSNAKKKENHPNFGKTWSAINGKRVYSK
jgi:group I intron endonuclease